MKKILYISLAIIAVFMFASCKKNETDFDDFESYDFSSYDNIDSSTTEPKEEVSEEYSSNEIDWRTFLAEYEDWVDEYIEFYKMYSADPTDMNLISQYADMAIEMADWAEKTENMQASLEEASNDELIEYSAEVSRIATKLASAY